MKKKVLPEKNSQLLVEHCANPWNGKCAETDIQLYVHYRGEQLPICASCWTEIADANVEWGGDYGRS